MDLCLDGRRHERREPPGHHLGPEGGVDDVECLQVFLVSAIEYGKRKLRINILLEYLLENISKQHVCVLCLSQFAGCFE